MSVDEATYASYLRGHLVLLVEEDWFYDDGTPVADDPDRPCPRCGRGPTPEGYDACTGYVPGATSVCCDHGTGGGFVMFEPSIFSRWVGKVLVGEGCWEWCGAKDRDGYGQFRYTPEFEGKAHRFAYEAFCGPIPTGLLILHTCDNPSCVNPAHLYAGTNSDNMRDRASRGRYDQTGLRNPVFIAAIRRMARPHRNGVTCST